MTISFDIGGQIGSDGTGSISGTLAANASADGIIAFVVQNAATADQITSVTADGKAMDRHPQFAIDSAGETGRVDAFFLGDGASSGGSQTIQLNVSGAATKRLYAASLLASSGNQLRLFRNPLVFGDTYALQTPPDAAAASSTGSASGSPFNEFHGACYAQGNYTNPSGSFIAPANRTIFGLGALFCGAAIASIAVTAGSTQITEANFSGGLQGASFLYGNNPVNTGTLTMGWTVAADDIAALWLAIEETTPISGTVTNGGSPVSGAYVAICIMDSVGALLRPYRIATTNGSGVWTSSVPLGCKWVAIPYHVSGSDMYNAAPHMSLV